MTFDVYIYFYLPSDLLTNTQTMPVSFKFIKNQRHRWAMQIETLTTQVEK